MAEKEESRTRRAGKLFRDSAVQTALRQFWLSVGGVAVTGITSLVASMKGLDPTLLKGALIGLGFCAIMAVLSLAVHLLSWTSDGLDTRTLGSSPTSRRGSVATVLQVKPSGMELPQPLVLRVKCSRELDDGYATFYSDSKVLDSNRSQRPIRAKVKGKTASFDLREPKLRSPAMLSIVLMWHQSSDDEDIAVAVKRRK